MNKTREAGGVHKSTSKQDPSKGDGGGSPAPMNAPPLKPRRGLLVFMAVVLVVLLAGLLALYFKTV